MRRLYQGKRPPFRNQRRDDHTHWIQCEGNYWDGCQFLDPQVHQRKVYARTYTLTGAKIALKALQKHYPAVTLKTLPC